MTNNLNPGRELDALVAEKVLGKKVYKLNSGNIKYPRWTYSFKEELEWYDSQGELLLFNDDLVPAYSTSLDVCKEILDSYDKVQIDGGMSGLEGLDWKVKLYPWDNHSFESGGQTLPHAICLAALKSIE